ncbi:hypothetical protein L1O03_10015 [Corynebacterium uropygiale]|uniref:Uncharacterized protein n=1 Tax=Corynebacterium uropygiale TaxID=1775911 RepID=A0A9X1QTJ0_9CORY|nr:hypothetical protein [Corynebacterium uropygiale]MCF4007498.1 hypothetical protein [Corynebacterium uropygiale]
MVATRYGKSVAAIITIGSLGLGVAVNADELHGRWVMGRILETYHRLGGHAFFGDAITDELDAARGGKYQHFERDTSIFWHPQVAEGVAHQVGGLIRGKWSQYSWERGHLGYPLTDEQPTRKPGRFNHFEGGSVYWKSQDPQAHVIQGNIRDMWASQDWEMGSLGFPMTDEQTTPNVFGKYNHFEGGSIYWSPGTNAHIVKGAIRNYWSKLGWENSRFGFPTSNEYPAHLNAIQQDFENQKLQWVPFRSELLPLYEEGDGSYVKNYTLIEKSERWTAEAIAQEIITHFNRYFTFSGCPDKIAVGQECELNATDLVNSPVKFVKAPVRVTNISSTGFSLLSLEGHPGGAGRTITFNFGTILKNGKPYISLDICAWGPTGGASKLGPINSAVVAGMSWLIFKENIMRRIVGSDTTYITRDKDSGERSSALRDGDDIVFSDEAGPEISEKARELDYVPLFPVGTPEEEIRDAIINGNLPATGYQLNE